MRIEVKEAIERLKKLDLSTYPFGEITTQLNNVGVIGYMEVALHPGKNIYRARLNNNDEQFFSKCQLTYKPQQYNKTCQRASTPNFTMFYGSLLPEDLIEGDLNIVRAVPSYEAVPWLRDKNSKGMKRITYTKWTVLEDVKLIALLQHDKFYDKSSYTKKLMDDFNTFLNINKANREETIKFTSFISGEFAKEVDSSQDYNYLISAAFTKIILDKGYDGVLYPSVRLDGKGFNVALTPIATDTKLQLDVVMECTAYKLFEKTVLDNELQAELYPNQTHFEYTKVDDEFHAGQNECLKALGVNSIKELTNS